MSTNSYFELLKENLNSNASEEFGVDDNGHLFFHGINLVDIIQEQIAIDQITNDIDLARSMAFANHDTITIQFSATNGEFDKLYSVYRGPNTNRILISDFPNSDGGFISLDNYRMRSVEINSVDFNNNYELQFLPLGDCDLTSEGSITLNTKTINIEPLTGKWTIN